MGAQNKIVVLIAILLAMSLALLYFNGYFQNALDLVNQNDEHPIIENNTIKQVHIPSEKIESDNTVLFGIISDHQDYTYLRSIDGDEILSKLTSSDTFYIAKDDHYWEYVGVYFRGVLGKIHSSRIDVLNETFYTIAIAAFNMESKALNECKKLRKMNLEADLLFIPNYSSLSGKEMYLVYIGKYTEVEIARKLKDNLKLQFPDAYGIIVSNEHSRLVF